MQPNEHPLTIYKREQKLSNKQLAILIGCSYDTLRAWQHGRRLMNRINRARVCKTTGIKPLAILEYELAILDAGSAQL